MTKDAHKSTRIGIYECHLEGCLISKGKWVKGYYALFHDDLLHSTVIPDLKDAKRAGWDFEFPVLVVSYYLGSGDPARPLPKPVGRLSVRSSGGIIALRRMLGIPVRRKRIPHTETWEAVIDAEGRVLEVEGHRLKDS